MSRDFELGRNVSFRVDRHSQYLRPSFPHWAIGSKFTLLWTVLNMNTTDISSATFVSDISNHVLAFCLL